MATTEKEMGRLLPWRVHWGSIVAGVFVALAVQIILGLIGASFGFAVQSFSATETGGLGAGALFWALFTPFAASLSGAWLAVRLTPDYEAFSAFLHGVLVWCIGVIVGALFFAGTFASGVLGSAIFRRAQAGAFVFGSNGQVLEQQVGRVAAAATGVAAMAGIVGLLGALAGAALGHSGRDADRARGFGRMKEEKGTGQPPGLASGHPPFPEQRPSEQRPQDPYLPH